MFRYLDASSTFSPLLANKTIEAKNGSLFFSLLDHLLQFGKRDTFSPVFRSSLSLFSYTFFSKSFLVRVRWYSRIRRSRGRFDGKSRVRGKLTWVREERGGDRFARHALYHEDSFREHRYFHPDQPRFFFTGFPRFPIGKISRLASSPLYSK